MEHDFPSIKALQLTFTAFQFAAPLNPGNINTITSKAAANSSTSRKRMNVAIRGKAAAKSTTSRQRMIIAVSQIRQGQPVTLAKPKGNGLQLTASYHNQHQQ